VQILSTVGFRKIISFKMGIKNIPCFKKKQLIIICYFLKKKREGN
jgi:hypothetical protein